MENLKTNPTSLNPENPCGTSVCGGGNLLINKIKHPFRAKAHKFFGVFKAFTLSEVLVTLTILGILASIIVPSVIQQYEKRVTITKLKKYYAKFSNLFQEMIIINNCSTVACMLQNNNIDYGNDYSQKTQLERLKLFFPDITIDSENKCVPQYTYSLNGLELNSAGADYNGENHYAYCLNKDNIGLTTWDVSFSSRYANCIDNPENKNSCAAMYLYLDKPNKKAIMGKNVFKLTLKFDGSVNAPKGYQCIPNQTDSNTGYVNGSGCLDKIIKDGWKINY